MPKTKAKVEAQSADQLRRFKEAAHALGCEGDEAAFKEKLGVIARQKPKGGPPLSAKKTPHKAK